MRAAIRRIRQVSEPDIPQVVVNVTDTGRFQAQPPKSDPPTALGLIGKTLKILPQLDRWPNVIALGIVVGGLIGGAWVGHLIGWW